MKLGVIKAKLHRWKGKIWRHLGWIGKKWEEGLPEELQFWSLALRDPAQYWVPEVYRFRTDPEAAFQMELRELLEPSGPDLRILDVGAGPLTSLGKTWPGRTLQITAIDPLAAEFDKLLTEIGLVPVLRTTTGAGENLAEQFPADHFDLTYASNALDHSRDPILVIQQMLAVTKPGGWTYLWHFAAEGLTEGYQGLHQWDFEVRRGQFWVGDGKKETNLATALPDAARIETEEIRAFGKPVVIAKIQKKSRT